jgi:hypothetical protein
MSKQPTDLVFSPQDFVQGILRGISRKAKRLAAKRRLRVSGEATGSNARTQSKLRLSD